MTLQTAFSEAAFIPYIAAGDPNIDASREYVSALERGGADVIELGLPFSEPIAEGPTIQGAVSRALNAGMTPTDYFEFVESLSVDVPIVCMTYYNLVYQYGPADSQPVQPFVARAAEVGISGFVIPDLPAEEAAPLRAACDTHGLDLIFIIAPTTTDDRLETILRRVSGYVYVQARLGVTGARSSISDQTASTLERIRTFESSLGTDSSIPKAVGFGIASGEQAAEVVESGADGVIVGSALVDIIAKGHEHDLSVSEVAEKLESLSTELKSGALSGADRRPRPERT